MHSATIAPPQAEAVASGMQIEYADIMVGRWKDPFFCCFNQIVPSCFMSFVCPCVVGGQISQKLHDDRMMSVVTYSCGALCVLLVLSLTSGSGVFLVLCWSCFMYIAFKVRSRARLEFQLPGGPCSDCLLSMFCVPCVIAQVARHIYNYNSPCETIYCSRDGMGLGIHPRTVPLAVCSISPAPIVEVTEAVPSSMCNDSGANVSPLDSANPAAAVAIPVNQGELLTHELPRPHRSQFERGSEVSQLQRGSYRFDTANSRVTNGGNPGSTVSYSRGVRRYGDASWGNHNRLVIAHSERPRHI